MTLKDIIRESQRDTPQTNKRMVQVCIITGILVLVVGAFMNWSYTVIFYISATCFSLGALYYGFYVEALFNESDRGKLRINIENLNQTISSFRKEFIETTKGTDRDIQRLEAQIRESNRFIEMNHDAIESIEGRLNLTGEE